MAAMRADTEGDAAGSRWAARAGGPTDRYLRARQRRENFPVALRVLPRRLAEHLGAIYDVTRVIDDLGDEAPGDRAALLDGFRTDLATIWSGGDPRAAVLRRLAATVRARGLSRQPFLDLIEANLRDQTVTTYGTFAELLEYCALSANPVGRIVLEIFDAATPETVGYADRVCTALQIIEHCQDVAEDHRAGRIYLPLEDLERCGVAPAELDAPTAGPRLRRLIAFEAGRAGALLDSGLPLLARLRGWGRLAVAGYVAGGRAAVTSLRRARWAAVPSPPPVRRADVARELARLAVSRPPALLTPPGWGGTRP